MSDARQAERIGRSLEQPVVSGLPELPGILAAMHISKELAQPLRALADVLLVAPWEGATIDRAEREIIATAVSAANDCMYCMDSHGAFSRALLLQREGAQEMVAEIISQVKAGNLSNLSEKLQALLAIALTVRRRALDLTSTEVVLAKGVGATDQDVQLAVLIAAGFSMYNRIVDGFRSATPSDTSAYEARGLQIAAFGYRDQRLTAVPGGPENH
ncbi:carboxymuconolactone decarboxylase family protein [Rhizobium sp. 2YAF20]|uniref:carboxymuconolactone decarboxylase family protein n=1 Tax=Rhizobium sp. 2YAF20 TaxID=3233027 RepID=UPI003F9690FB